MLPGFHEYKAIAAKVTWMCAQLLRIPSGPEPGTGLSQKTSAFILFVVFIGVFLILGYFAILPSREGVPIDNPTNKIIRLSVTSTAANTKCCFQYFSL